MMVRRMEDRAVEMRRAVIRKDFPLLVEVNILQQDFLGYAQLFGKPFSSKTKTNL